MQGKIRPGYKQTEVGLIPKDWKVDSLGNVLTLQRGFDLPKRLRRRGPVPIVTSSGIEDFHNLAAAKGPGIITGRYGTIGKVYFVETDYWPLNTTLWVRDFHGNDPHWGYRVLQTVDFLSHSGKSGVPGVNRNDLHGELVLVPNLPEQRAIAAALADADALIAALEGMIAKKRDLKQAAMQNLLTGKTRLPGFSGEWEVNLLGDLERSRLIQLGRGKVISKLDIDREPGEYPIYSSSVQLSGLFGRYQRYMFDEEMITWSVDGGGHFFYRPKHRFSVTNVCGFIRVDKSTVNCRFLASQLQFLHSKLKFDYQDKAHPSVIRKAYTLALPSINEQTAIAEVLSDMDADLAALEAQAAKARAVKQGMMQELLTGRVRLV